MSNHWRDEYNWDALVNYVLCGLSMVLGVAAIVLGAVGH